MTNEQEKRGSLPLIETETEQRDREAREAAQAPRTEPEVVHEGGNPLGTDHHGSEAQAPVHSEELIVKDEGSKDDEPVQTGNATWNAVKAFWNRLGEITVYQF